jgi:excisionase family DNA binding protein
MAGKFLSPEEAARLLGVSSDEVNRLVDRKQLFPMRDGATVKFKADDVDRLARDRASDGGSGDDLSLDLDLPAGGAADEIALGEPLDGADSIFAGDLPAAAGASQTIVRGAADKAADADLALSSPGGLGSDDLALDSIIAASSPSLARGAGESGSAPGSGLTIDLGDTGAAGGGPGSIAGLSVTGAALSGVLDSGLSLEDGAVQISGIDIGGAGASGASAIAGGSGLGGDEFELGGDTTDDESASVVIATEDTGDSSFFGAAVEGDASAVSEDLSADDASVILGVDPGEYAYAMETPFSALQITGLVCCSLLLLFGGFMMYDLVRTIGSPEGPSLANPLLGALAETFGWR